MVERGGGSCGLQIMSHDYELRKLHSAVVANFTAWNYLVNSLAQSGYLDKDKFLHGLRHIAESAKLPETKDMLLMLEETTRLADPKELPPTDKPATSHSPNWLVNVIIGGKERS